MSVERINNRIVFFDNTESFCIAQAITLMEEAINERGYKDIELDFSGSKNAFASGILRLCSYINSKKENGITFSLFTNGNVEIRKLFINQNWAYLIDPSIFAKSNYKGYRQVPSIEYSDPQEQQNVLNSILDKLICSYDDLERSDFASIEWALNEIMDNVLVHSESKCGGIVSLQTFNRENKKIEFVVSDSGIGIPNSLRSAFSNKKTNADLLLNAVQEGVTNGKGQGNGLYGSLQMCRISGGFFSIDSGGVLLTSSDKNGIHVLPHKTIFNGTTVYASINANRKGLLANALRFKDEIHIPIDFIETSYEIKSTEDNTITISIDPKEVSVGSRISGNGQRIKIENILLLSEIEKIYIDFNLVSLISSSFADEYIAKLFVKYGKDYFNKHIEIINANTNIKSIIQKAILQRCIVKE